MKFNIREWKLNVLFCASAILLASLTYAATNQTRQLAAGDKAKVAGPILSVMENWYASATRNRVKSWL